MNNTKDIKDTKNDNDVINAKDLKDKRSMMFEEDEDEAPYLFDTDEEDASYLVDSVYAEEEEEERREELEIEEIEEIEDEPDPAPTDVPSGETKKRNPFHLPLMVTGALLILLIAGIAGGTIYLNLKKERKHEQEVAASLELREQELREMEEAARAQAEEEVKRRLDEARREGYEAGERDLLVHVQAQIESGSSIVEVLRLLFLKMLYEIIYYFR